MYWNLTRFCFSVPYAHCIAKINDKNNNTKKNPTYLPTYPKFFDHVTPNTYTFLDLCFISLITIFLVKYLK